MRWALVLVALAAAPAWAGEAPRFEVPIGCIVGEDCFVQNYVDHDAGPGASDFTCGNLSYEGHDGTDIRLRDLPAMAAGVAVLAAADGVVLRRRDGMDDVSIAETGSAAVEGREAGNGVVIDHGGGWETQYSHMRKGSVRVEPGQPVEAGDPIGLVGLSGLTEFPHVHFEVRRDGGVVDPFVGLAPGSGCGTVGTPLWSAAAAAELAYVAGGLLVAGFATEKPDAEAARRGDYRAVAPTAASGALVFWVDLFGTRTGDDESIRLIGPDGAVVAEAQAVHDRDRAAWFRFVGARMPDGGWPPGTYLGSYTLTRPTIGGVTLTVVEIERTIELR